MILAELKEEIPRLTLDEKFDLAETLSLGFDARDLQMHQDCKPGGKLDQLCKKANAGYARGKIHNRQGKGCV